MEQKCDNVPVDIKSDTSLADHEAGKKPGPNLEKVNMLERSIYTKGYSPGTTKEDVVAAFGQFGNIKRIIWDSRRQFTWAFVEFEDKNTALKCIGEEVEVGNAKIKAEPRSVKPKQKRNPEKHGGLPVGQRRGRKSNAPYHNLRQIDLLRTRPDMIVDLQALANAASVEDQINKLIANLELTAEEVEERAQLLQELTGVLKEYLPECSIYQFGSSASGIGIKGSDVDLFLDLGLDKQIEVATKGTKEFPTISGFQNAESFEPSKLKEQEPSSIVRIIHAILKTPESGFKHVNYLARARVPVVRFCHDASGLRCDLSLNNRLAVQNTRMIQVYQQVDPRVRPLLFVIRHWAKQRDITGDVSTGRHMSNYALTLMVLFYLQAAKPPVIPSVEIMSDLSSLEEELTLDDWDVGFCMDPHRLPLTRNKESLEQLLMGFFKYYNRLAFTRIVLSVRKGVVIPLSTFTAQTSEDPRYNRFKRAAVNVQDPFNLSHNTTQNMHDNLYQKWVMSIDEALGLCARPEFINPTAESPYGLLLLCADIAAPAKAKRASLHPSQWQFNIDFLMRSNEACIQDIPDQKEKETVWLNQVSKLCIRILSKVFKVDLLNLESDIPNILSHMNGAANDQEMPSVDQAEVVPHDDLSKPLVFSYCSSVYSLWQGRKAALKELKTNEKLQDSLELEEKVSEILSQKKELKAKFPMLFEVAVLQQRQGSVVSASLRFLNHGSEAHFIAFFSFLKSYIFNTVSKYLSAV